MTESEEQPRLANPLVLWLAVAGAGLLVAGTFCPVVVLSSGEGRSYRDFAWADGNVVLGAGAAAFVMTWAFRWYRGLFVAGAVALFMTGATLLKVSRSGLGDVALGWGWLPLFAGTVLLVAAALVAEKDSPARDAEAPEGEGQAEEEGQWEE
jgi:hypothetical protein